MIIYKITNTINNKVYIGQTTRTIEHRWSRHCDKVNNKYPMGRAIQKYGKDKFKIEVIYTATSIEDLNDKEAYYIKKLDTLSPNGYNLRTGGSNSIPCKETREKLSKANKASLLCSAHIKKLHQSNIGKKRSPEAIKRISDGHLGQVAWNKGKTGIYSEEHLKRMSESRKGIPTKKRKPILCITNNIIYPSLMTAAESLGLNYRLVSLVALGHRSHTGGYKFKYVT